MIALATDIGSRGFYVYFGQKEIAESTDEQSGVVI